MRRTTLLFATFLTALIAGAGAAQAKGVTGGASINGPGAGGPGGGGIHFDGDDASNDGFWTLLEETGVMSAVDASGGYDVGQAPPTDRIGPRYTLNWDLEQFEGPDVQFVQYVYPYAGDESWIYTPHSVTLEVGEIPSGWHHTGSNSLRYHLETYGLPRTNPEGPTAAGRAAQTAAQAEASSNYFLPLAIVAGLIAVIVIASRRVAPRPARTT
jgi:hypothetical protein